MTEAQAKQILLLYRPGSPDAGHPEFAEALALVRQSPALEQWFVAHCKVQATIGLRLKGVAIPAGLKEQILSERKIRTPNFWPKTPRSLVTSCAALLVIGYLGVHWFNPYFNRPDDANLDFYRSQMVGSALRNYRMDLETNNLTVVRSFLAERQAEADWVLPKGIAQAQLTGCGILGWQDRKVSMICFHSGRPLPAGQQTDLFLFVVDRKSVHHAPTTKSPKLAQVNQLVTATWSIGDKTYVLAAEGDETFLRKFL